MKKYFANESIKDLIENYLKVVLKMDTEGKFQENRSGIMVNIMKSMITNCDEWDLNTQFNICYISEQLTSALSNPNKNNEDDHNLIFITFFRFYSEYQLYKPHESMDVYSTTRTFMKENIDEFSEVQSNQVNYVLYEMPTSILRFIMSEQDFGTMRDFLRVKETASQYKKDWDNEILEKQKEADNLREALEKYKTGFNFVALYAGFSELGIMKKSELNWAKFFMFIIGATIPAVMMYSLWHFINKTYAFASLNELIIFAPASAITLVLLYYFRISLATYNSIRAQLMQIELRKSLCQFIQDYSKYSSAISKENAGLLSKFEDVIFSNIMTSEDKIPSTFDGLEQIATLIKAVKIK